MAGINNAEFCSKFPVGLAVLGGFSADKRSMLASKKIVWRGRREFLFEDPVNGIKEEIERFIELSDAEFAVNVRSYTDRGYIDVAEAVADYNGIIEINAHCRQPEMMELGCGQALLFDIERLCAIVEKTSEICTTSVKIRGGLDIDYAALAEKLKEHGCDMLHVDAMIVGGKADLDLIRELSGIIFTIGNNSVTSVDDARKMIECGAELVSCARAVLRDENFFTKLLEDELLSQMVVLH